MVGMGHFFNDSVFFLMAHGFEISDRDDSNVGSIVPFVWQSRSPWGQSGYDLNSIFPVCKIGENYNRPFANPKHFRNNK